MSSAIDAKYNELIGANSWIGKPATPEQACPDNIGRYRHYAGNASIYWHPQTGAHLIYGLIRVKWAAMGWEKSPLGYPNTDELNAGSGKGRFNNFQAGTIIWKSGSQEAFAVYGDIYHKWGEQTWDKGYLGFPVTDETGTPDGRGRYNHFEGGSIYWTPTTGAHIIIGYIRETWAAQGWERGGLGYPLTDELVTDGTNGKGRYNRFEGGVIHWTPEGGTKVTVNAGTTSHVRIEVHRVHCGNTEDASGADELYIVGALSDGTTSRGALTSPMSINDNQEKEFNPSQRVIFDADVEPNAVVRGGLKAFDEDFGKDWAKYGDTVNKISAQVSQGLKSTNDPRAVAAGEILGYATKAFGFFASLDKDDELGTIELNVPAQGSSVEEIAWKFQKKGSVFNPGVSTWNYTVVIRVTRS